jgi:formate-nitrite transporter family protein
VFAGWLIALMVWTIPAAETTHAAVGVSRMWIVGMAGMPPPIAASTEVMNLLVAGAADVGGCLRGYPVPRLVGNTIGGVLLGPALNRPR